MKFNYTLEFDAQNSKNKWKLNTPLIEYCETIGITIPHYCYHKDLSIAGNCRMCLIEIKKSPKPVVSCALTAKSSLAANTEVYTNSPLVKKARENIMEFLLLNHPLDCPICDQGGECDLQDQSLFFGITKKRFYSFKRVVTDKDLGPIIKTVMSRCIHCTRCVRFSSEIAGVNDLGIFGRGINSEIGTYVDKIFQSELSGNVIDICPVGALTSKPYPFVSRDWELKKVNAIDPSDGFGLNTQIFLKNNKVIKILPGYNQQNYENNWISDKTRFLFDGMFSSQRNINKFLLTNLKKKHMSWDDIFKKITIFIYLFDHLERHSLKINSLTVLFEDTVSIEVISLLTLLEKKYPFIQLRKSNNSKFCNDFESDSQLNNVTNTNLLSSSNLCLLLGVNSRYESPYLNLKLKKRFVKGNFLLFSLGSQTNLTFPSTSIGSNLKKLKQTVEGNSSICKNIKNTSNLLTVMNTDILNRKDFLAISNLVKTLKCLNSNKEWNVSNMLSNSLNFTGISHFNNFKTITKTDLIKSNGLFLINNTLKTLSTVFQLIELQFLNYTTYNIPNKLVIEQNNKNLFLNFKAKDTVLNYLYLPNNTFFETSGTYITTEGFNKQNLKLISSQKNTKNDWQILRKFISTLDTIKYIARFKQDTRVTYNSNNMFNFKNFTCFLYLNTCSLSKISFYLQTQNQKFTFQPTKKLKKLKLLTTQLKKWIEDFYLGGYDNYCNESKTLVTCSSTLRVKSSTFKNS